MHLSKFGLFCLRIGSLQILSTCTVNVTNSFHAKNKLHSDLEVSIENRQDNTPIPVVKTWYTLIPALVEPTKFTVKTGKWKIKPLLHDNQLSVLHFSYMLFETFAL